MFQTTVNLTKFSLRAEWNMHQELAKTSRESLRGLQTGLATVHVNINHKKERTQIWLPWEVSNEDTSAVKKMNARKHQNKGWGLARTRQHFWNSVLCTYDSNVDLFGHNSRRRVCQ